MVVHSAGLLVWRTGGGGVEILLVHPGGPYWATKDDHAWSIPKGEFDPDAEDAETAARREFAEELGTPPPAGPAIDLGVVRAGSKHIHVFSVEGDLDPTTITSNDIEIEWPPRSGRTQRIPEIDRAEWVAVTVAEAKLHKGQAPIAALAASLGPDDRPPS